MNEFWASGRIRQRILASVALVVALVGMAYFAAGQIATSTFDLERIQRATVFVMQARNIGDDLIITCVGSGTLVNRSGLVLTNAHNTLPSDDCPGDTLVIALSVRLDQPPIPKYRAEIAQANAGVDLALLRITRELDGRLIDPGTLALPFVELAEPTALQLDETITIVGYPGIGRDPLAVEQGTITGFVTEPSGNGDPSWIKTRASIPGTMSGGGAYDEEGRLVGIPTTAPLRRRSSETTCQPIQDSNRDGLVNANDICIPIGGFINSLRPASFGQPLLRAAALQVSVETLTGSSVAIRPSGQPAFRRLFFSPSVNEAGMPTSVIGNLPAGNNSLYLFFDYENMTPETIYELSVTIGGLPNSTFSLAPVRWSGGERGLWYIGSSGQPWPNGLYEFTLFANGVASETARLIVGTAADPEPVFLDIVFGILDLQNNIQGNGFVLPVGNTANASFVYQNLVEGIPWSRTWYYNGTEFYRESSGWASGTTGATTTGIQDENGLLPGAYRLELRIEDRLAATSDFTIAGTPRLPFPEVFSNVHFASAGSPDEARTAPAINSFSNTLDTLYAVFDWQQIAPGTLWTLRWLVDGELFYQQTTPWSAAESGTGFLTRLARPGGLPDGTYQVELLVNNVQLVARQASVGIGQLPIDRFAQASGVQLRGQILDASTGEGIPGVSFLLISKDFSVEDFEWRQDQLYATAVTDRHGNFQIDRPLEYSTEANEVAYSVIITAEGYLPITADGLEVDANTANPLDLTIYLTRD